MENKLCGSVILIQGGNLKPATDSAASLDGKVKRLRTNLSQCNILSLRQSPEPSHPIANMKRAGSGHPARANAIADMKLPSIAICNVSTRGKMIVGL